MDAITLGELLIDFVCPTPDRALAAADSFIKAPGGAPANVAVGLRRLGLRAGFIGCVGRDPFGDYLEQVMVDEGVDTSQLQRSEVRTTLAFVATRRDGRKDITFYRNPGADAQLDRAGLTPDYLRRTRLFHFCSVSLSQDPARTATLEAARLAREGGALISFDPNWRAPLWADPEEGTHWIGEALRLADVVKVADEELEQVCGTVVEEAACERLLAQGAQLVVVTRGAAGAVARTPHAAAAAAGFEVEVVDPLGAGDAFVAGFLARLLAAGTPALPEAELTAALRFANAAGALATQRVGVIPALPTPARIEEFLAARPA